MEQGRFKWIGTRSSQTLAGSIQTVPSRQHCNGLPSTLNAFGTRAFQPMKSRVGLFNFGTPSEGVASLSLIPTLMQLLQS